MVVGRWPCHCSCSPLKAISFKPSLLKRETKGKACLSKKVRVLSLKIFHSSDNSHSAFLLKAVGQWPCHCSHFPLKVIFFKLSLALLELIMQRELNRKNTNLWQKWVLSANIFHSSISGSHHPFPLKAVGRWPCQWLCSTMWMESTPLKVISYKCSFPSWEPRIWVLQRNSRRRKTISKNLSFVWKNILLSVATPTTFSPDGCPLVNSALSQILEASSSD